MGREKAKGLPWFKHDTALDDKMVVMQTKYGNDGYAVVFKLYEKIYQSEILEVEVNEVLQIEFLANFCNLPSSRFLEIMEYAVHVEIFDTAIYAAKRKLTSNGIKKRAGAFFQNRQNTAERVKKFRNSNAKQNGSSLSSSYNNNNILYKEERERVTQNNFSNNVEPEPIVDFVTQNKADRNAKQSLSNGLQSVTQNNFVTQNNANVTGYENYENIAMANNSQIFEKLIQVHPNFIHLTDLQKQKINDTVQNLPVWVETLDFWFRDVSHKPYRPNIDNILDNYNNRLSTSSIAASVSKPGNRPTKEPEPGFGFFADLLKDTKFEYRGKIWVKIGADSYVAEDREGNIYTMKNIWNEVKL